MLSLFPRGVLDEILNLIELVSVVSEGFPSYYSVSLACEDCPIPTNKSLIHIAAGPRSAIGRAPDS